MAAGHVSGASESGGDELKQPKPCSGKGATLNACPRGSLVSSMQTMEPWASSVSTKTLIQVAGHGHFPRISWDQGMDSDLKTNKLTIKERCSYQTHHRRMDC